MSARAANVQVIRQRPVRLECEFVAPGQVAVSVEEGGVLLEVARFHAGVAKDCERDFDSPNEDVAEIARLLHQQHLEWVMVINRIVSGLRAEAPAGQTGAGIFSPGLGGEVVNQDGSGGGVSAVARLLSGEPPLAIMKDKL